MPELFDPDLRQLRRDRAVRGGPVTFLHERAVEDLIDRLDMMMFDKHRALVVGLLSPELAKPFAERFDRLDIVDPSPVAAAASGGSCAGEPTLDVEPATYDAVIALGTLDTAEPLPETLLRLRLALKPDRPLVGVMPGGQSLARLANAMIEADRVSGVTSPHVHPRVDPPALTQLLASAGYAMPVVDIDRVSVRYGDLASLVADLRGMGTTNILRERSRRPIGKAAYKAAKFAFLSDADTDGRVTERFELLHFAGWNPASPV
ncbi:class I SAM-dependent methyltransferase [Sphingomicrobium sediminis]|uniref:Class I SAM-dependent methyltransferase n=1 Tax=Sphingomicrobium sediminis TaxID=2950949 RepID=A0A9X2EE66_9SPHN|nr:class I SAM-dependent methyltransferase [Sphingomicrobium sediminis]MCM8556378.1 class I SAM-dependent methyltransferase [Sphingomicrobium sediminis]